jgi:multidrug efflux pump subunit AcrB
VFYRFFIDRPIFASVLSIFVTLAGLLAVFSLPVAQYPEITPPTVEVSAVYPGANAQVVADTVAAPIEQQVNGVENMMYMSSQCTNDGTYTLTVTFKLGVDLNMAQVLVQNRVTLAQPVLPDLVKRRGVMVKKKSPSVLMIVNLYYDDQVATPGAIGGGALGVGGNESEEKALYLSNYATIQLRDELSRLPGVGDITYLGQRDYSMRLWLDPQKMASKGISAGDVITAVGQQNQQVAAGQIGQPPVPTGQGFQYILTTQGRLADADQFADIIIKSDPDGRLVHLKDVAEIKLGALAYDQSCTLDRKPSVALSIYQLPGSNALQTAQTIKDKMKELKNRFPPGIKYSIVYDTTPFIQESINEVFHTLRDAVILVALVVLLFLQNWRSALIPLAAVPVAVIGTFAVMWGMGFSLNNLTLFGLVLAIGIVVDDAIVVVEAVEHHLEHGLSPREATVTAMSQVAGPVVAVGLVLSAVFIPCAFIAGIIGQFFRQFALTIATSTLLSAFNSLTLSPALSALLLKPRDKSAGFEAMPRLSFVLGGAWLAWRWLLDLLGPSHLGLSPWVAWPLSLAAGLAVGWYVGPLLNRALGSAFYWFNRGFEWTTEWYTRAVGVMLTVSGLVLAIYGGLLFLTWWSFTQTPTGFIPTQDKGYLLVNVQLPDAASVGRTRAVMDRIEEIAKQTKGVKSTVAVAGQSLLLNANAPNFGAMYVMLDDFEHRHHRDLSSDALAAKLLERFKQEITDAQVSIFQAPPVDGLGTAGGFKIVIEDRGDLGMDTLQEVADKIVENGAERPELEHPYTSFRANTPWLFLDVDREQAKTMGVSMEAIGVTMQSFLASYYINDFNRFGRTWQVNVQAQPAFRADTERIKQLKVPNGRGGMSPLASVIRVKETTGPVMIVRYNMYQAATVTANASPSASSGQAIDALKDVTQQEIQDVASMRYEWTELALLQLQAGNTAMFVFFLAVVLVFLVLAAQYESWSLPLAVILVVPMCLLCSIAGVAMASMDVNIFTQIGFVVLVGLACKNAILIVEYAKAQREAGVPRFEATLAACKLRLRPIVMTSFAFILGVVPLVIAEGAGAEMRRTLGTAVFAGMLGVTAFGIFLTPVFFYVIQGFTDWRAKRLGREIGAKRPHEPGTNGTQHHAMAEEHVKVVAH